MPERAEEDQKLEPNPLGVRRDFSCKHYNRCLDRAVRELWAGFSCDACSLRSYANIKDPLLDAPDYDPERDCNAADSQVMVSGEEGEKGRWEPVKEPIEG